MFHILLVAIGGAIGSVARYLVGLGMTRLMGLSFPWGTLTVNIVGSFAIGILTELVARRFDASTELRLLLVVGVLGGFTTFSSFSLDTMALIERGATAHAFAYVGASLILALGAAFGGLLLGRSLF
ncbi:MULTISPECIES: fluoride efflux transporter CrcB [Rhizobium]|uniref:Fluoride-specific ion channel FluC n=1 Tax=Rhizobium wuzhouense TaxID=1986026 RepID=A0ABX5NML0_9HYPH|nr:MULTISPECIES: fluoride efflux transporter CrcB [Rhizobium]PYB71350.1 fluoride efflux transporter CrcB [Rhizobium wuzhouense]RKE84945.1 camphor resistance protein CrcB [Rhizobium sp. AG855]